MLLVFSIFSLIGLVAGLLAAILSKEAGAIFLAFLSSAFYFFIYFLILGD